MRVVVNYGLNHSRYIGSRRVRLPTNEEKLIARANKRAKAKSAAGKAKNKPSPEEKAANRARFLAEAQRIAVQMEEARAGGDVSGVLRLYGQAERSLFNAFGKKAAMGTELYETLQGHWMWARECEERERREQLEEKIRRYKEKVARQQGKERRPG
ncbi:hypothetical protein SAMN04489712_101488 [Thermomonospora echinospora]|uniref:Uncharacterized protein n=1 Tax=Thermomonospora echinospora TaxID=1992 RepID=A0A1H5T566_9ACTN|nr:hypothetical protein [Thermomonospora echinospora]SEF57936.1 hypothetical protein SAMN04489712_101488 [Thermomonospora echinospora]